MKEFFFILGAADPEMVAIEEMVIKSYHGVVYAMVGVVIPILPGSTLIGVECAVTGITLDVVVDHHRPADPGYGKEPAQYWEASSNGQASALLGIQPKAQMQLVAAADHWLAAAYAGQCSRNPCGVLATNNVAIRSPQGRPDGGASRSRGVMDGHLWPEGPLRRPRKGLRRRLSA
jgi:hypothetical protein